MGIHNGIAYDTFRIQKTTFGALKLQRPESRNAIDRSMVDAWHHILPVITHAAHHGEIRGLVISGEGSSFCSGGDMKWMRGKSASELDAFMRDATMAFRALMALPVPVIAKIQGGCIGGGFELALHCDVLMCESHAVFGFPEVKHGWTTTAGSVARLIESLGVMRAKSVLLGLKQISAEEAQQFGLVYGLTTHAVIDEEIESLCQKISEMPRESVAAMKRLCREHSDPLACASWHRELATFRELVHNQAP